MLQVSPSVPFWKSSQREVQIIYEISNDYKQLCPCHNNWTHTWGGFRIFVTCAFLFVQWQIAPKRISKPTELPRASKVRQWPGKTPLWEETKRTPEGFDQLGSLGNIILLYCDLAHRFPDTELVQNGSQVDSHSQSSVDTIFPLQRHHNPSLNMLRVLFAPHLWFYDTKRRWQYSPGPGALSRKHNQNFNPAAGVVTKRDILEVSALSRRSSRRVINQSCIELTGENEAVVPMFFKGPQPIPLSIGIPVTEGRTSCHRSGNEISEEQCLYSWRGLNPAAWLWPADQYLYEVKNSWWFPF